MEDVSMSQFPRPLIVISKCLGFAACRYDMQMVTSAFVGSMKSFVEFIDVCPECEIGLGVPREPVLIVLDGGKKLIQPATGLDLTIKVADFAKSYLEGLDDFDGFILKSKSPSCGIGTTKAFADANADDWIGINENGFFADTVVLEYPHLPTIDEVGMSDIIKRDDFLTRTFALAAFRETSSSKSISYLLEYHTRNKLLFMAYDKDVMDIMGNIAANRNGLNVDEVYDQYLHFLLELLSTPASPGSVVNAMMHAFGYVSRYLSARDKFLFLGKLQAYRENNSFIFELRKTLKSWAAEFKVDYLCVQTLFSPYPQEITDGL
jgi:uncharacterized protein YbgA (DUF1722 family)/uncharacterized protein YbbK (DUF523 family)